MTIEEIRRASSAHHEENRKRAIREGVWLFDESIPATGCPGGMILAPDGVPVAYVLIYSAGWRERVEALLAAANGTGRPG